MKCFITSLGLMLAVAASSSAAAQISCATNFGACPMASGIPGGPCFCATPTGPIQGITQTVGVGGGPGFPQFCCTPAGRIGPFPNTSIGPGQMCQAPTPAGMIFGQACF